MSDAVGAKLRAAQPRTEGAPRAASAAPIVRAEGLHKSYRMGRTELTVLVDCSVSIATGEFLAIMGKSGSGKSTLLHILGALDVPQSGQVHFLGGPVLHEKHNGFLRSL